MRTKVNRKTNLESDRITEYVSSEVELKNIPRTEIAKQPEFYKIPRRFGSIPVDELPLGCDKDEQYYKVYPRISLPFQRTNRYTKGFQDLRWYSRHMNTFVLLSLLVLHFIFV